MLHCSGPSPLTQAPTHMKGGRTWYSTLSLALQALVQLPASIISLQDASACKQKPHCDIRHFQMHAISHPPQMLEPIFPLSSHMSLRPGMGNDVDATRSLLEVGRRRGPLAKQINKRGVPDVDSSKAYSATKTLRARTWNTVLVRLRPSFPSLFRTPPPRFA